MQEDRGRDYNNAKRVSKEYESNTRGLDRNTPSVPPQTTLQESQQVKYCLRVRHSNLTDFGKK